MVPFTILQQAENYGLRDVAFALLTIGAVGLIILIYNILPMHIDSTTDGYRLTMVSNPKNKIAFNELLRVEYEMQQGHQIEVKVFDGITNFTADLNLNRVYALLDERKYQEAEQILDMIIAAKKTFPPKYISALERKRSTSTYTRKQSMKLVNITIKKCLLVKEEKYLMMFLWLPSERTYLCLVY